MSLLMKSNPVDGFSLCANSAFMTGDKGRTTKVDQKSAVDAERNCRFQQTQKAFSQVRSSPHRRGEHRKNSANLALQFYFQFVKYVYNQPAYVPTRERENPPYVHY